MDLIVPALALAAAGAIGYAYNVTRPIKVVELLRPRDSRGMTLKVVKETDLGLTCKKAGGVVYRFIKRGRGWTFNKGGRMMTKFFGVEGTAYTGVAKGNVIEQVPVAAYLEELWGKEFYEKIPEKQKKAVERDVVGVTIEVGKIDAEREGLPPLTANDLNDEGDSFVLEKIAQSARTATLRKNLAGNLIWLALGALLMFMATAKGWL